MAGPCVHLVVRNVGRFNWLKTANECGLCAKRKLWPAQSKMIKCVDCNMYIHDRCRQRVDRDLVDGPAEGDRIPAVDGSQIANSCNNAHYDLVDGPAEGDRIPAVDESQIANSCNNAHCDLVDGPAEGDRIPAVDGSQIMNPCKTAPIVMNPDVVDSPIFEITTISVVEAFRCVLAVNTGVILFWRNTDNTTRRTMRVSFRVLSTLSRNDYIQYRPKNWTKDEGDVNGLCYSTTSRSATAPCDGPTATI